MSEMDHVTWHFVTCLQSLFYNFIIFLFLMLNITDLSSGSYVIILMMQLIHKAHVQQLVCPILRLWETLTLLSKSWVSWPTFDNPQLSVWVTSDWHHLQWCHVNSCFVVVLGGFDEDFSDGCMAELMGSDGHKKCGISLPCLHTMSRRGYEGYYITHQLLYTILAEQVRIKSCHKYYYTSIFRGILELDMYKNIFTFCLFSLVVWEC